MRLRAILLHLIAVAAFAVAALAQEKKPPLPPGRDPGGVAIALVTTGIDYTVPEVAQRLARDGEGELILAIKDACRLIHHAHLRDGVPIGKPLPQPDDRPDRAADRQPNHKRKSGRDADDNAWVLPFGAEPFVFQLI